MSSIMELQEDAYRVRQVLENVDIKDIIQFMRTKVALLDTEIRCQLALQHFLNLEDASAKKEETYDDSVKTDLLCMRHLLKSVPEEEIVELLNVLGPIPNRKYVAAKLLLRDQSRQSSRKKRKNNIDKQSDIGEASSSKVFKISDLNRTFQLKNNHVDNLDSDEAERKGILKLTIKSVKDRNGNDQFMVTSPVKSEPKTGESEPQEISVKSEVNEIKKEVKPKPSSNSLNAPVEYKKQNSTENVNYELPSTSNSTRKFKIKPASFNPPSASTSSQNNGLSHLPSTNNTFQIQAASTSRPEIKPASFNPPSASTSAQNNGSSQLSSTHNTFSHQASPSSRLGFFLPEAESTTLEVKETDAINNITFTFPEPTTQKELNVKSSNVTRAELLDFDIRVAELEEDLNITPQLDKSHEVLILNENANSNEKDEDGMDLAQAPQIIDEKLVFKLVELFPHITSEYIRSLCAGKTFSEQNVDEIMEIVWATEDAPQRPEKQLSPIKEVDLEEQLATVKELLPDADPSYLHEKLDMIGGDSDAMARFLEHAIETKEYPTMKEYLRKQQLSAQQRQYTTEFNVERFVELFPDPVETFEDPDRKTTILDQSDKYYVKWFMRNKYNQLYAKDVNNVVETEGTKNIVSIVKALNTCLAKGAIKKTRWVAHSRPDTQNIPLLQELAYFDHIDQIYSHIECRKAQAAEERKNAKELGLMQTCSCCYDDEVMPSDILTCCGGCRFCRDCIKKGTEVAFGEGKLTFPCLMDCGAEFSLQVLQNVLPPKVFSKLAQKKAVAEVKAAGVEDLETCPFCDFATIPAPEDKLFRCLNQDCMKESCRLCKEPSHVPLRCEEVEKDQAIKARTYIEDKMTEALIRQCWKCNAKFIKEEGCNKMTCSCGAIMCYVCRKPVKDYKHFNGQGGDRHDLCPLYTDNFSVNEKNVLKAAEEAKKQIDPTQLKNDPTADLEKHFGDKIKEAERREKRMAAAVAAAAPRHGQHLPEAQLQVVQRLRRELREQLRMVHHDLNINPQNIIDAVAPQLNQAFAQRPARPRSPGRPAQPPIRQVHHDLNINPQNIIDAVAPQLNQAFAQRPARPRSPGRPAQPPIRQGPYLQVRAGLQERPRMVHFNINPQNVIDAAAPQLNQDFAQRPARPRSPGRPAQPPIRQGPYLQVRADLQQRRRMNDLIGGDLPPAPRFGVPQHNPIVVHGQIPPPAIAPQHPRADI